jgi:hypothetical protein
LRQAVPQHFRLPLMYKVTRLSKLPQRRCRYNLFLPTAPLSKAASATIKPDSLPRPTQHTSSAASMDHCIAMAINAGHSRLQLQISSILTQIVIFNYRCYFLLIATCICIDARARRLLYETGVLMHFICLDVWEITPPPRSIHWQYWSYPSIRDI